MIVFSKRLLSSLCHVSTVSAWVVFFFSVLSHQAWARNELKEFYRGVRPQAMGNAFTAIADDADAIFYNPAGISFNSGMEMRLLNPKFDMSTDDLATADQLRTVGGSGFDTTAITALFGKNLYGNGSVFPCIMLPHFTFGYFADFNAHAVINNLSLPHIDMTYYYDQGFMGGFGFESKGLGHNHLLRYGVSLKALTRRGFDGTIPITTFATANSGFLKTLISGEGTGYGVDLGFQYEVPAASHLELIGAAAWHDLGDTTFGTRLSTNQPPPIKSNLAIGGAAIYNLGKGSGYNAKFSLEGRHMEYTHEDPRKKIHLGTELDLGTFAIQAGMSQLNWTAGASVDLFFVEVAAVSYAVENMPLYHMSTERRYMVQLTLKIDASFGKAKGGSDWERKKRPRLFH